MTLECAQGPSKRDLLPQLQERWSETISCHYHSESTAASIMLNQGHPLLGVQAVLCGDWWRQGCEA